ncbi:MAG: cupin domain-containing protein [Clostridia bacterium]|nr:cupin domain-containing protein [Clostridia bacterium]
MAKILNGNWMDLPWMPDHSKDVDGKVTRKVKHFGMESSNLLYTLTEMENGMPTEVQSHRNEKIVLCLQGEVDYVVNGVPYRLTAGSWVNVPPYYEHFAHVYRSPLPCQIVEVYTPARPALSEPYKIFLKEEYGIIWEEGGTEVADLTQPKDPKTEVR